MAILFLEKKLKRKTNNRSNIKGVPYPKICNQERGPRLRSPFLIIIITNSYNFQPLTIAC